MKLIYYDDQSSPAQVPGIYSKLLDVDKVDFAVSAYASTQIAAAMPIMIQKKRLFISLFGTGINDEFNYDKYFSMLPTGPTPKPTYTRGLLRRCDGAESEAAVGRDRRRRRRVRPQRLRRRARERQEPQAPDHL